MSQKRKSSTQPLQVQNSDMIFEDEDDDQQANSVAGGSTKGSGGSRISNRAKKVKSIYDPSEFNGPVHKRKKEALEVEKTKVPVRKLSLLLQQKSAAVQAPKPESAADAVAKSPEPSPKKTAKLLIKRLVQVKAKPDSEPRKLPMKKPVAIQPKPSVIPTVPAVKEPSKRIQARKLVKGQASSDTSAGAGPSKKQRIASASTGFSSDDDFDVENRDFENRNGGDIPDVSKWTHHQVSDYFTRLGFNARDAAMFKEEEIDGETLLIMRRSDIVNTSKLKLGTTLKMWSEILKFQTGSNDPTQGWK